MEQETFTINIGNQSKTFIVSIITEISSDLADKEGVLLNDLQAWLKLPQTMMSIIKEYLAREKRVLDILINKRKEFSLYMYNKYYA